jgi:hypothetical protein
VADILRHHAFTVFGDHDDEIPVRHDINSPPYFLDICAVSGQRVIVVEIDGYKGHKSRRGILKDSHRTAAIIRALNGKPEVYRFAFWQLKDCEDSLIEQELGLTK